MEHAASPSPQNLPASPAWVDALYLRGHISREARDEALAALSPHDAWRLWAGRMLAVTGGSLLLAAILYFYAFNWAKLTPLMKLGSVELAIAITFIAALVLGVQRVAGQSLLTASAFLVGVFLAVFGQIYQTGADAWQLFAVWSGLIFGWVWVARFAPLWALWLVVANIAIFLFIGQELHIKHYEDEIGLTTILLFNGSFLMLREWTVQRGHAWLAHGWTRQLPLLPVLFCAAWLVLGAIWGPLSETVPIKILLALLGGVAHIGLFRLYRHSLPDIRALSLTALSGAILSLALFYDMVGDHGIGAYLLCGGVTVAVFAQLARYLHQTSQKMEAYHD